METTGVLSWRKASYSSGNGGDCIEVASAPRTVAVRDSKNPEGPELAFHPGPVAGVHPQRQDGGGRPLTLDRPEGRSRACGRPSECLLPVRRWSQL